MKVPVQEFDWKRRNSQKPVFIFKTNDETKLVLPLQNNTSFMHSGKFVTHRQNYQTNTDCNCDPFLNFASYSNEKLFNHLRKTFERLT